MSRAKAGVAFIEYFLSHRIANWHALYAQLGILSDVFAPGTVHFPLNLSQKNWFCSKGSWQETSHWSWPIANHIRPEYLKLVEHLTLFWKSYNHSAWRLNRQHLIINWGIGPSWWWNVCHLSPKLRNHKIFKTNKPRYIYNRWKYFLCIWDQPNRILSFSVKSKHQVNVLA